ncbi:MAG TPA: GNAT family N-acetyltransferase [Bacilli bacterium]|nr:GNAT family N-acetyltransferase [Bacilli bacterium]
MLFLESERLRMVPFTLELVRATIEDRQKLKELLQAEVPANWPNPDFAEVLPMIAQGMAEDPSRPVWDGLILEKETNRLVGDMGLKGGPDESGTADMGYSIVPEYQGRGYATEMANALIDWCFRETDIVKITAECLDDNTGSIRVLEKVGLRRLAPEDNMLKWEITKAERV